MKDKQNHTHTNYKLLRVFKDNPKKMEGYTLFMDWEINILKISISHKNSKFGFH